MDSLVDKLYQLDCEPVVSECASTVCEEGNDLDLWHQRLGHLNGQQLSDIAKKGLATGISLPITAKLSFCEGCVEGKMHRKPFKSARGVTLHEDYNWCIVTSVGQCRQNLLVDVNIL